MRHYRSNSTSTAFSVQITRVRIKPGFTDPGSKPEGSWWYSVLYRYGTRICGFWSHPGTILGRTHHMHGARTQPSTTRVLHSTQLALIPPSKWSLCRLAVSSLADPVSATFDYISSPTPELYAPRPSRVDVRGDAFFLSCLLHGAYRVNVWGSFTDCCFLVSSPVLIYMCY